LPFAACPATRGRSGSPERRLASRVAPADPHGDWHRSFYRRTLRCVSERWADLDALMRQLGALRAAADDARATSRDRAAIEKAITNAAQSIDGMIDTPQDAKALTAARSALFAVEERVARAVKGRAG
jgi:hypothetical protein